MKPKPRVARRLVKAMAKNHLRGGLRSVTPRIWSSRLPAVTAPSVKGASRRDSGRVAAREEVSAVMQYLLDRKDEKHAQRGAEKAEDRREKAEAHIFIPLRPS